jgi:hypothetical protein
MPGVKADVKERLRGATGCTDQDFLDFLASLLCYEPTLRLTPRDAFFHPFMDDLLPFKALFAAPLPASRSVPPANVASTKPKAAHRTAPLPPAAQANLQTANHNAHSPQHTKPSPAATGRTVKSSPHQQQINGPATDQNHVIVSQSLGPKRSRRTNHASPGSASSHPSPASASAAAARPSQSESPAAPKTADHPIKPRQAHSPKKNRPVEARGYDSPIKMVHPPHFSAPAANPNRAQRETPDLPPEGLKAQGGKKQHRGVANVNFEVRMPPRWPSVACLCHHMLPW